ncbi:hypothetical protein HBI84_087160 [Parastagonospora nodorum]|nr:hypothetical protein HBI84_087160 [Parastagonospora nodorum]
MSYLDRFLQFPVITPIDAASLPSFKSSCDAVVVGYTGLEDPVSTAQFESLAKSMHPELVFGVTDDSALAQAEGIKTPAIVVYNNAADERGALPVTGDIDELKANIRKAALPLIVNLYPEIHEDLLDMGTPFAYIFTEPDSEITEDFHVELEQLVRQHRGKIQFSIATASKVPSIVLDMHLQASTLPALAIRDPLSNLRYPMLASTTAKPEAFITEVTAFTRDYLALKLQPTIKSEPIPPSSTSAMVKVVGQTYVSIVNDSTRDVLLVFCIEVCAPCDRLYPTLEALAEMYRAEESQKKTTVATILHDKNDTGLRRVRAFPTIMLFPARDKGRPVRFLGDRTVAALKDFISANRSL